MVLDLQIGNMGGMATCLDLRLEESADRLPHVGVLMLLQPLSLTLYTYSFATMLLGTFMFVIVSKFPE